MMKQFLRMSFTIAMVCLLTSNLAVANPAKTEGYNIKVKINALKDTNVYLAYHFGDKEYMKDTVRLNGKGEGVFKGKERLEPGIYLVVMPSKTYFEIVVSDKQDFSVENDTSDFIKNFKQTGSEENQVFYDDMRFIMQKQKEREELVKEMKADDKDTTKKKEIREKLSKLDDEVLNNRKKIRDEHPNFLYTKILYMLEDVKIPDAPKNDKGQVIDSFYGFHYYKAHYFDHMDLADPRMLKTPILYNKVDNYLEKVCSQDYDSVNNEVDMILKKSLPNDTTFRFWLVTLLNKYANSKVMGQDEVYVHLVDKYYSKGMATWLDSADLYRITTTANEMKPTLIGKKAPPLMLKDSSGEYKSLYDLTCKYILLFIYDPDCGHCQKETPHVVNQYDSLKGTYDICVYAATIGTDRDKWVKFIKDYKIGEFTNAADLDRQDNFRSIYDVKSTPRIFLLDKDRVIRAKRFGAEQLGMILEGLEKMEKDKKKRSLQDGKNRIMNDDPMIKDE